MLPVPTPPPNFRDVLALWPTLSELARDIDFDYERVAQWRKRDWIPPEWFPRVLQAAEKRGFDLTLQQLMSIASTIAEAKEAERKGAA